MTAPRTNHARSRATLLTSGPRLASAAAVLCACSGLLPSIGHSEPKTQSQAYVAGASSSSTNAALRAILPTEWLPSRGRECIRRGKYRGFCQGPRRVPAPRGAAAEIAERLGLGTQQTVNHLLLKPPEDAWVTAAGPDMRETLLWPVPDGKLWRGYGRVTRGGKKLNQKRKHKGVDIGAPEGTLIRSAKTGVVAYSDNGIRGYGNLLMVVHTDATVASYAHCKAIYVFPGQHVERGQVVAEVGHTGIARGSHLHFEYRRRGITRDPEREFVERPDR